VGIYILGQPTEFIWLSTPLPRTLLMSTYSPSTVKGNEPCSRFCYLPSPSSTIHTPPGDVQPNRGGAPSHIPHIHDQPRLSPLVTDHSLTTDHDGSINLAGRLRSLLPPNYLWLGQGDLMVVGTRPIDAGGFADVWAGEMGDRKVAVKSYRRYTSADYWKIYWVSDTRPWGTSCSLTTDL